MLKTCGAVAGAAMLSWSIVGMFEKVKAAVHAPSCYHELTDKGGIPEDNEVKACTDHVVDSLNSASKAMVDVHRRLLVQTLKAVPSD